MIRISISSRPGRTSRRDRRTWIDVPDRHQCHLRKPQGPIGARGAGRHSLAQDDRPQHHVYFGHVRCSSWNWAWCTSSAAITRRARSCGAGSIISSNRALLAECSRWTPPSRLPALRCESPIPSASVMAGSPNRSGAWPDSGNAQCRGFRRDRRSHPQSVGRSIVLPMPEKAHGFLHRMTKNGPFVG